MLVMATNPIKSVAELKGTNKSISLGGDNAASSNVIYATIAKRSLGLNVKVVTGYTRRGADVSRHAARRDRRPGGRL